MLGVKTQIYWRFEGWRRPEAAGQALHGLRVDSENALRLGEPVEIIAPILGATRYLKSGAHFLGSAR